MQNIEFKAELRDPALARMICDSLHAPLAATLEQTDTYFRVPDAKLKKREVVGGDTQFIFYNRPNRSRPKLSSFTLYSEAQALERFGVAPLPVWVIVRKSRDLHFHKGVRIHIDRVEGPEIWHVVVVHMCGRDGRGGRRQCGGKGGGKAEGQRFLAKMHSQSPEKVRTGATRRRQGAWTVVVHGAAQCRAGMVYLAISSRVPRPHKP